jgi:acetyl esterase/lipase
MNRSNFLSAVVRLASLLAALGLCVGGCSAVGTLNALSSSDAAVVRADVAYGTLPAQRLDIYRPTTARPDSGWPVVVFFYGGSWNSGERADYEFVGKALAARGVLALIADYRLYPAVRYPDFLRDSAQALAYGLAQAASLGGDPRRVFVMGHSAGGYNAAMLVLDPRWLEATGHSPAELAGWIGLAGPYDFFPTDNRKCSRSSFIQTIRRTPNRSSSSLLRRHALFLARPLTTSLSTRSAARWRSQASCRQRVCP